MHRPAQTGRLRNEGLHLQVLTPDEIEDIHQATLEVLEQTGVFVEADDALDIYADGGCRVDREKRRVRIPPEIVEESIRSCPSRLVSQGHAEDEPSIREMGRVSFTNFCEGMMFVDPWTGEYRSPTKKDVGTVALLVDAMDDVDDYYAGIGALDQHPETYPIHGAHAAFLNTGRPVGSEAHSAWEVRKTFELAVILAGGDEDKVRERQMLNFGACTISPLKLPREMTDVTITASLLGIPAGAVSMSMAGGTAPVTLAGTLVMVNCENLAVITLTQLANRGAPLTYGASASIMDLKYATTPQGCPEAALLSAAVANIAKQYRLPCYISGA